MSQKGVIQAIINGDRKSVRASEINDAALDQIVNTIGSLRTRAKESDNLIKQAETARDAAYREAAELRGRIQGSGETGRSAIEALQMQLSQAELRCSEAMKDKSATEKLMSKEVEARLKAESKITDAEARVEAAKGVATDLRSELLSCREEIKRMQDQAKEMKRLPAMAPRAVEVTVAERDFRGLIKRLTVNPG